MLQTASAIALALTTCAGLGACSQQSEVDDGGEAGLHPAASNHEGDQTASAMRSTELREDAVSSGILEDGRLLVLGDSYSLATNFRRAFEAELPDLDIVYDSVGGSSLAEQLDRLSQREGTQGWPILILDGGLTDREPLAEIREIVAFQQPRCDMWFYVEAVKRGYPNERVQKRRHRQIERLMTDLEAESPNHGIRWNEALYEAAEGTMDDKYDIEEGIMPGSLRRDRVHLNREGYSRLAAIIAERIRQTPAPAC